MTILAIVRFIGLPGLIIAAGLIFYEGLPGVNYLTPYLRIVPALGPMVDDLAQGRVGRSFSAGQLSERLAWQEKQAREQLKRDDERREAQAKIDRIELEYWQRQMNDALKIADLEKALEAEPDDAGARCAAAITRGVSRALNAIGREAGTGEDTGKP